MIRRLTRRIVRLGVLAGIGYGVAKLIESARAATDVSRPAPQPWRPAIPADPAKVEGDALLAPHGDPVDEPERAPAPDGEVRGEAEPVITSSSSSSSSPSSTSSSSEKPPSTPRPAGRADTATKAPAAKKAPAKKVTAPPKPTEGESG